MIFVPGKLEGILRIELEPHEDPRGSFTRTYCRSEFTEAGLPAEWVQCNHTVTKERGAIRGMHWQADPYGECKIVHCLRGQIFDVVVDIRKESATFGKWESIELSDEVPTQLFIPHGFAHGFQCLSDDCHLFYQMSQYYNPASARCLRWDDEQLAIPWPLEVTQVSENDQKGLSLPSLA